MNFFEENPEEIEQELINLYLEMVGPCSPGSPQNNFIKAITYMLLLQQRKHDTAFKQNLWRYANGDCLKELGEFRDIKPIEAKSAQGLFKVTLLSAFDFKVIIQKDLKVTSGDGINFLLKDYLEFLPGEIEKMHFLFVIILEREGMDIFQGKLIN